MEGVPPEVEALLWGIISALALPLGALASFAKKKPSLRIRAGLMAFGAGALLFALSIELFGQTVCDHKYDDDYIIIVAVMAGSAILGGFAFQGIEHLINSKGGFFRSLSTKFSFIQSHKEKAMEKYRERLERLNYLENLEHDEVKLLVKYLKRRLVSKGTVLFDSITSDTPLFFLRRGAVELTQFDNEQVELSKQVIRERGWIGQTSQVAVSVPMQMTAVTIKPCYLITIERKYIALVIAKKIKAEIEKDEESSSSSFSSSSSSSSHSAKSESGSESGEDVEKLSKPSKRSRLVQSLVNKLGDGEDMVREANDHAEEIPMSEMSLVTEQLISEQNLEDKKEDNEGTPSESGNLDDELSKSVSSKSSNSSRSSSSRKSKKSRRSEMEVEDDPALDTPEIAEENVKEEMKEVQKKHNVARAIWLGLLIDAVPESLVIGSLVTSSEGISITFIAGVFLANFPEALSSSILMQARLSKARIMLMWFTITAVTGVGAVVGSLIFRGELTYAAFLVTKGIEGLAGGAMLVVIAKTMLPEAFEMGAEISGLATLFGFLAALLLSAGEASTKNAH